MKRGGSFSFLVGTISNVLVMEIGRTDVGSGGYILVSCAHSNTSSSCIFWFRGFSFALDSVFLLRMYDGNVFIVIKSYIFKVK